MRAPRKYGDLHRFAMVLWVFGPEIEEWGGSEGRKASEDGIPGGVEREGHVGYVFVWR